MERWRLTRRTDTLTSRRALEALRNGVPNREAVKILGCSQPEAEGRFEEMLAHAADRDNVPDRAFGMLVSGDFGSGKSHLLTHLEQQALSQGFVCSKVAISKETPLYDLGKVFKSAVDNGRMPNRAGRLIEELGQALKPHSQEYASFFQWANDTESNGLSQMFPASLLVHELSRDLELNSEIEYFWAGDRIKVSQVKDGLRQIGQFQSFSFRAPKAAELPPQRLRFVIELIKAAGYKGWVVLLDEIELVGSYSLLQRGRSYAELARWLGQAVDEPYSGLVTVGAVTDDFASAIISPDGKKDRDYVGPRLARADRYKNIEARAETGMRLLEREVIPLKQPTDTEVRETRRSCGKSTAPLMTGTLPRFKWRLAAPGIRTGCATRFGHPSMNGTYCGSTPTTALKPRATSSATRMKRTPTWNGNPKKTTTPNGSRLHRRPKSMLNCLSLSTT